eukprot:gene9879-10889_t
MKSSENAEFINRKLDCWLLTSKLPKSTLESVGKLSKPRLENDNLSKETLAQILQVRRAEDRILNRLDYWIYGEIKDASTRKHHEDKMDCEQKQTWNLEVESRATNYNNNINNVNHDGLILGGSSLCEEENFEKFLARSVSSIEKKSTSRRNILRPWKNEAEKCESVSMFHYKMKSANAGDDDDDTKSTATARLRTKIFTKFGTLPRKKLKMFFTKAGNNSDENGKKIDRKKSTHENEKSKDNTRSQSFFSKYKRKSSTQQEAPPDLHENETATLRNRGQAKKLQGRTRPQSEIFDYDYEAEEFALKIEKMEKTKSQTVSKENDKSPIKNKLRTMPIFYVPPETHMI